MTASLFIASTCFLLVGGEEQSRQVRDPDEAVVETTALYLLSSSHPDNKKRSPYLAVWPEYSKKARGDFLAEVKRVLSWEAITGEERVKLESIKDSLSSERWPAPSVVSAIEKMKLDPRLLISRSNFNKEPRLQNGLGQNGYVAQQVRFDPPTFSSDGQWAVVHPYSMLWGGGSGFWYDAIFLKRSEKGWSVDSRVSVLSN